MDPVFSVVDKVKAVARSLGKKIRDDEGLLRQGQFTPVQAVKDYLTPTYNQGQNFWSTPLVQQLGNFQQTLEQKKLPMLNLTQYAQGIKEPAPRVAAELGLGFAENLVNLPQRTLHAGARLGKDIRTIQEGGSVSPARAIGTAAEAALPFVDILTLGGGTVVKGLGEQALKQVSRKGLKETIKKTAAGSGLLGASYGALGGATEGEAAELMNVLRGTALGGLIGGALGGIAGGVGGILGLIKRSPRVEKELLRKASIQPRDPVTGRWTYEELVKPKEMSKAQWEFQLKFNEKYGRNPYMPVFVNDLQKALEYELRKKQLGLSIRDINEDVSPFAGEVVPKVTSGVKSEVKPETKAKIRLKPAIPKELEPLAQEARKYKSVEDFVTRLHSRFVAHTNTMSPSERQMANYFYGLKDKEAFYNQAVKGRLSTKEKINIKPTTIQKSVKRTPKELESLVKEAKNYKSAEEFVNKTFNNYFYKKYPKVSQIDYNNSTQVSAANRMYLDELREYEQLAEKIFETKSIKDKPSPSPLSTIPVGESSGEARKIKIKGPIEPKIERQPPKIKIKQTAPSPAPVVESTILQNQPKTKTGTPELQAEKLRVSTPEKQAADPLPNLISKSDIDVKSKVGLHDYIRTPDRVLKKIGLENESNFLRRQYEKYLKELPQEIDRIAAWSKRVPPESNQRIFKYLDGQNIQLNKEELKVANEIRDYLSQWADRLKLPKDKRISHYITHIFEKDFIEKEFDPELAKIIRDKVAGSVYDPFLEKRLGKLGYVEDTWQALDAYVKRATRKANMDVALEKIKEKAKNLEISQYNYVKKYIDNVNLRPTDLDNLIDNTIKQAVGYRFGQRPTALLTRAGRRAVYRGALGLNIGTALKNLTQGVNTYAKLGEKFTLKGYWDILTKGTRELEEQGILKQDLIQDRSLNATRKFWETIDKGLFYFFETAEKINRGAAYYGAKAKALAQGLNEQQAIEYAKKIVRDTQFQFGSIDTPVALQSDIAKLLTQFQTFSIKQVEFLVEMAKNKEYAGLLRYAIGSIALASTLGKLIGMEWKDFIPSFRIEVPPTLATPVETTKALLGTPDEYGNIPDAEERLKNIGKTFVPFIPGGVQIKKTIQGLTDVGKGYAETSTGRIKYPISQTPENYIKGGLFGKYNLPEARKFREDKTSILGEKQSDLVRYAQDRMGVYNKILQEREEDKKIKELKAKVKETGRAQEYNNKFFILQEDGEVKTLDLSKITPSDTDTNYQKALKLKKAFSYIDDILDSNMSIDEKGQALAKLGIDPEDAAYYNVARQTNDIKEIWVRDEIGKYANNRQEMLLGLLRLRREVNGKTVLADGVIDSLHEDGIISYNEKKWLKNAKYTKEGQIKVKLSGRGKSAKLKSVRVRAKELAYKAPKLKAIKVGGIRAKGKQYARGKIFKVRKVS